MHTQHTRSHNDQSYNTHTGQSVVATLPTTLVGWYVGMTQKKNGHLSQCITHKMAQTAVDCQVTQNKQLGSILKHACFYRSHL